MENYPAITLKKGKDASIRRRHHWVFSGAIAQADPQIQDGDIVRVLCSKGEFLAIGHYQAGFITVRVISFEEVQIDDTFWNKRLSQAYQMRKTIGLTDSEQTTTYRLVHGEGDQLPGLIIDYYQGTLVLMAYTMGMYAQRDSIVKALQNVYGAQLEAVYDKSSETLKGSIKAENQLLYGSPKNQVVLESGSKYEIDWEKGQKSGFFIDQRENRKLVGQYSKGKKVLNTFCYSGGFSIAALQGGATEVHSVDISAAAIELTEKNLALNPNLTAKHESKVADVVKYIREIDQDYDLIILDPPAFAKNIKARHSAVQAYKRLNAEALKHIKPGGILFTFSCSQVVDKKLFANTITAAAIQVGRSIKILEQLSQPADHPVNVFHPESEYLKGLILYVE
ncbi:SAM-dependent methyltransferase [Echinicola pacifica]|uniref:SAM-dependent methyltransferase n=1 Tax=Echinicola pacifica TaxID=346377 RepID=A0A918Q6W7_9BACT|nr:class I SAM-dependent rRNA methyltransferase [Echinicola pacifica]GGZ32725.1 SAM-dependent methyltransferase [Echinicola pacifica]